MERNEAYFVQLSNTAPLMYSVFNGIKIGS